jgi:hypothetical protein
VGFLRAAASLAVVVLLLFTLAQVGHLLPWHRSRDTAEGPYRHDRPEVEAGLRPAADGPDGPGSCDPCFDGGHPDRTDVRKEGRDGGDRGDEATDEDAEDEDDEDGLELGVGGLGVGMKGPKPGKGKP